MLKHLSINLLVVNVNQHPASSHVTYVRNGCLLDPYTHLEAIIIEEVCLNELVACLKCLADNTYATRQNYF